MGARLRKSDAVSCGRYAVESGVSLTHSVKLTHPTGPHHVGNPSVNVTRKANLSSPGLYDFEFTQKGNYRLTWGTDEGLFKTFHEPWAEYVNNGQEVSFLANLSLTEFLNLDLAKPVRVHGMVGFIRDMVVEFPLVYPIKVTIIKRN